jgi:hypothetical protein
MFRTEQFCGAEFEHFRCLRASRISSQILPIGRTPVPPQNLILATRDGLQEPELRIVRADYASSRQWATDSRALSMNRQAPLGSESCVAERLVRGIRELEWSCAWGAAASDVPAGAERWHPVSQFYLQNA